MKISRAQVANFRLLKKADIAFDVETTMIVGRNNSGKTSLVEIFRKFLGSDAGRFAFDDLSLAAHASLDAALDAYSAAQIALASGDQAAFEAHEALYRDGLPAIELQLTIEYDESDQLAPLAPFIMDLDADRTDASIVFSLAIKDPEALFDDYIKANASASIPFLDFVRSNFRRYYGRRVEAVDTLDSTKRKAVEEAQVQALISTRFIYAQNQFDDLSTDTGHGLSRGFESFYKSNKDDSAVVEKIAELLASVGTDLDTQYKELFSSIFEDLKRFGVGRMSLLPELSVVSEFEAERVIAGNAHLYYSDASTGRRLPEAHNGLGYSKLIFTILQFISFYEELKRMKPRPPIQAVFVEEPEAHLHPQMQYVFVKNIRGFVESKDDWGVQTVITTHSSHIVAESGFRCIRYFDNSVAPLVVRDLSDYEALQQKNDEESLKFLKRYMVLGHCDMFFAEKVILIEGTVERLLLPEMIKQTASELLHQHVSVVEVGGAYAHLFRGLIEFLNVQTLIITDIDSVDPNDRRKALPVAPGLVSSNSSLAKWLPGVSDIDGLLAAGVAKTDERGRVTVAYQVAEEEGDKVGRSFEEAFILANASVLAAAPAGLSVDNVLIKDGARLASDEIAKDSYEIADRVPKKTDFAFDIMTLDGWIVPRYLREGLEWLNSTP